MESWCGAAVDVVVVGVCACAWGPVEYDCAMTVIVVSLLTVPLVLNVGKLVTVTVFGGVLSMVMSVALSVLSSVPVAS